MRYFSFFAVASLVFGMALNSSCNKKTYDLISTINWLPDSVIVQQHNTLTGINNMSIREHEYDSQNRLKNYTIWTYSEGSGWWRRNTDYSLKHNTRGDFIEYESCYTSARCTRIKFSTGDNKITFIRTYHPTASLFGRENGEIELNAQGLPVKLTAEDSGEFITSGSNYWSHTTVTLTWHNGNLTKADWVHDWKRESIVSEDGWQIDRVIIEEGSDVGSNTYTYDDKKNPFYHCNTPKWLLWWLDYDHNGYSDYYRYNANNIKTDTKEDGSSITYEYTYNNAGFPEARTWSPIRVWGEIVDGTTTETYSYKEK